MSKEEWFAVIAAVGAALLVFTLWMNVHYSKHHHYKSGKRSEF